MAEPQSVTDEYELWKKNCRFMYEFVLETALTWPSLTVQWLPQHLTNSDGNLDARLLLGTHTSGQDQNYLKIALTELTTPGNAVKANSRIKITKKFANDAEINRGRVMPQDGDVVATINGTGELDVYNIATDAVSHFVPHNDNGYGLSWNRHDKGRLLSGSDDKLVVVTNVDDQLTTKFAGAHDDIVNDVAWHYFDAPVFGSVSDDKTVKLWDYRTQASVGSYAVADSQGINTLGFSPFLTNLFAVGNTLGTVTLFDRRQTLRQLHLMMGHAELINILEWDPHHDGVLALGLADRRVIIWDIFKIGEEQQQEDAEDGAPELMMMHAGHTGGVTDLSWCPYQPWTLALVADDNLVHLWQVGKTIVDDGAAPVVDDADLE